MKASTCLLLDILIKRLGKYFSWCSELRLSQKGPFLILSCHNRAGVINLGAPFLFIELLQYSY
jgi:hypothetical protein